MGNVALIIARVGLRSLENRTAGLMNNRLNPATKPNWTNVSVTG